MAVHTDGNKAFRMIRKERPTCTLDQVNHGAKQYAKAVAHDVSDKGWPHLFLGSRVRRSGTFSRGQWKGKQVYIACANNNAAEGTHRSIKKKFGKNFSQVDEKTWDTYKDKYCLELQWRLRHRGEDAYVALLRTLAERAKAKYEAAQVADVARNLFLA